MTKAWIVIGLVLMSACGAPPMSRVRSENNHVAVDVLTEFEGVRVYRVYDDGRTIYIAISAAQLRAEWMEKQGKTFVRRETVTLLK